MAEKPQPVAARQGSLPSNITELKEGSPFKQSYLSRRDHDDPEFHYIGEALPVPSIIKDTGPTSSLGTSPIPAREDHVHAAGVTVAPPVGSMMMWGGPSSPAPANYLLCDGRSLLRTDYPALFGVIGTIWGSVDATHFNLPDMRSTFPRGGGSVGVTGGYADSPIIDHEHGLSNHTHGMGNHTHSMQAHTHGAGGLVNSTLGGHSHDTTFNQQTNTAGGGTLARLAGLGTGFTSTSDTVAGHAHNISGSTSGPSVGNTDVPNNNNTGGPSSNVTGSTTAAVSPTNRNLPPYANVHFMIRALP